MNAESKARAPSGQVAAANLTEGAVFAGRYRIVRSIAAGGMGSVFEVIHIETERRHALKVMHPHLFQSDEMRERFKREARIAALVESDHIVHVLDAGVDEATRTPFLVMELLRGEELGQRLKRLGRLPPSEVVACLYQVALALDETHKRAIVHRDLKPENVFLSLRDDGTSRVKVLDFGVAKLVAETATAAGATRSLGTPLYMAPEQFRVGTKLTASADIYALGMMAYTLLVGQPYWAAEARGAGDVIAYAMVVVQGPQDSAVQRAAKAGVTLPPAFDAWFERVSAASPGDRYTTASEAIGALVAVFNPPREAQRAAPAAQAPVSSATPSARPPLAARGTEMMTAQPRPASPPVVQELGIGGTVVTRAPATPKAAAAPDGFVRKATVPFNGAPIPGALVVPAPPTPVVQSTGPVSYGDPGPIAAPGVLDRLTTSTGAAIPPLPAERRRSPLLVPGILVGLALLAGGGWLVAGALRGGTSGAAAGQAGSTATSAEPAISATAAPSGAVSAAPSGAVSAAPSGAVSAAPSTAVTAPGDTASASAEPVPSSTASAVPSATGKVPAAKASAAPGARGGSPAAKATSKPLLGRD